MTITVVANTSYTPPRNEITIAVPAGNVMKNPVLSRIVNGAATAVRSQPAAGFDTRTVYDYEMPYGALATYEFVTDYTNPGASVIWDEVWSNLTAWTGATSGFAVASGRATGTVNTVGGATISRTTALGSYRVVVSSLSMTGTPNASAVPGVDFRNAGAPLFVLGVNATGAILVATPRRTGFGYDVATTTISGASPVTVDFLGTSIAITGTGGTYTISGLTSTDFNSVNVTVSGGSTSPATLTVGEIKITAYPASTHIDQLSTPAAITPAAAWLIHPSNPALSMPVSSRDRSTVSIRSVGEVTNRSTVTDHPILGQDLPITTTSGPRAGNVFQMVLGVRTRQQEQALRGLLADGTPILFRAPPSYPIGIDEGYYAVGDISRSRISQRLGDPLRDFTLPLTQVQSPVVAVQSSGWSWAMLAAQFPTWAAVAQAFNTWADVLTNNRKPGY